MATAVSLPTTWKLTIAANSGITGLILPGMIEEPGCKLGRLISARPVFGPDDIMRTSFEMRMTSRARLRRLPETDRHRILHVGTPGLHHIVKLLRLGVAGAGKRIQHGVEIFQSEQGSQAHRGREDVVRALPIVHMVIRMDDVFTQLPTHDLR